ncbi:hypothetical protein MUBE_02030 [Mycobacterium uberis]|uniref:PPE domain-containing protein n=1 Tax=Mycobacterium uberis TaxID=2162698 RepID=A0A3E1HLH4_9MYCO|nr:hypothetical protein MUBE_02030 [Mycobacterium uberis]
MATAFAPCVVWMHSTADQAEQAGYRHLRQRRLMRPGFCGDSAAGGSYGHRELLAQLVSINVLGINTSAIANNEAQYGQVWVEDTAVMLLTKQHRRRLLSWPQWHRCRPRPARVDCWGCGGDWPGWLWLSGCYQQRGGRRPEGGQSAQVFSLPRSRVRSAAMVKVLIGLSVLLRLVG